MATRAAQGMPAPRCPRVPPSTTVMPGGGWGGVGRHTCQCSGWVGVQCPVPQGTGLLVVASLGYSLVCLSRAAAAGVPAWCSMSPQGTPWPQQPPVCHSRGSRDPHRPLLFRSAGMEPPRGPRPAQPPNALPAAAGPGRSPGCAPHQPPRHQGTGFPKPLSASPRWGVLPPGSSPAPERCQRRGRCWAPAMGANPPRQPRWHWDTRLFPVARSLPGHRRPDPTVASPQLWQPPPSASG